MNRIDRLYMEMIRYYQGDPKHIQHFVKVHSFSRLIGQGEGLDESTMYTLEAAALVHDIGIKKIWPFGWKDAGSRRSGSCKGNAGETWLSGKGNPKSRISGRASSHLQEY